MHGKRGGRVQINVLQFRELAERVEKLEEDFKNLNKPEGVKKTAPKKDKMEALDAEEK